MDAYKGCKAIHTEINGHKVTFSFQEGFNPSVAKLVKTALIDSFIRSKKMPMVPEKL